MSRKQTMFLFLILAATVAVAQEIPRANPMYSPGDTAEVQPPGWLLQQGNALELEKRGDDLRAQKDFLQAMDFYKAALKKSGTAALLHNKMGMCNLMLARYKEARKDFQKATKADKTMAEAWNNLGVVYYLQKKYRPAIKNYKKAVELRQSASFHSNLGTAYFAKKEYERAAEHYQLAFTLDPSVFDRSSQLGLSARMGSPEEKARYAYMIAKMYAKNGDMDKTLQYLRRAMEEGYKEIDNVYKDNEFATIRKDQRFAELMATKPVAIAQ
jgi:tetratricopeptide (TPR) repeat protein